MPVQPDACADRLTAVTVGVTVSGMSAGAPLRIVSALDASSALRLVRNNNADLLVTGMRIGNEAPWSMIRRLRIARPWQHWALAADELSDADEIEARSLRVSAILGSAPDISALLALAESITGARRRREADEGVFRQPTPARRVRDVAGFIGRS
jgi:hypothetical protein